MLGGIGCAVYLTVMKYANPDMTSTRLFLTFWKIEIAAVACLVVGFALVAWAKENQ